MGACSSQLLLTLLKKKTNTMGSAVTVLLDNLLIYLAAQYIGILCIL